MSNTHKLSNDERSKLERGLLRFWTRVIDDPDSTIGQRIEAAKGLERYQKRNGPHESA